MEPERAYFYSFYIGLGVQLLLVPFFAVAWFPTLLLAGVNVLLTLFAYPWFVVWLAKSEWSPLPPELGPHQ
jgi:hypothetical protein